MNDLGLGVIIFACVFGGAMAGMLASRHLPEHHLAKETEDAVRLGIGVIATMSALVLGLLLAEAKGAFDTKDNELKVLSANLILLDRNLAHYGPETRDARDLLRRYTAYKIDSTWPDETTGPAPDPDGWMLLEDVQDRLRALTPKTDGERWLQSRALQVSGELSVTRWLLRVQTGASIPRPFLVILVCWLTVIFASFGLFAPQNGTAIATLFVCALAITTSIFLILELAHPIGGLIRISSDPLREALALLGR